MILSKVLAESVDLTKMTQVAPQFSADEWRAILERVRKALNGVSLMNNRRRLWPWIVAALVLLLVVYPLAYGPWWWLEGWCSTHGSMQWLFRATAWIFSPLDDLVEDGPDWLTDPYWDYCVWCRELGRGSPP